ncbi:MAG: spore coat protein CotJB [Clostridiales bacterium]|nr:spore coat protein CotJB [Clostridiales bacterium]
MTPLAQLQALDFVLQELALYLDTHKDDEEAFELFQQYTALMERSRASYERQNGPLNLTAAAADSSWQWTHSPWPWDLKGED